MYTIYVVFKCFPGKREAFIKKVNEEIVSDIRNENGCIKYDYYLSEKDENEILLVEAWESLKHQQIHMEQPHMAKYLGFKDEYIESAAFGEFEIKNN